MAKWSGLGMMVFATEVTATFDADIDALKANGYTVVRLAMCGYTNPDYLVILKAAVLRAQAKGMSVIFGVGAGEATLTATGWTDYRLAILDLAAWAQTNDLYEFQLGNEEESHNDDDTLTDAQLRINLKAVATEVQVIYTKGQVSYSCSANSIDAWIALGKGDIDVLCANVYKGGDGVFNMLWKTYIKKLIAAFGASGTYLSEFSLSWTSLADYTTTKSKQVKDLTSMLKYIKDRGMTKAIFYCYINPWNDGYGAIKANGTYRQIWYSLLGHKTTKKNNQSVLIRSAT